MATLKQIQANRRNARRSTGPRTPEGKDRVRFNGLVHGLRAESVLLPTESQARFNQQLDRVTTAWNPQDDFERDLVEQIAVFQWKLARLDRSEATLYTPDMPPDKLALSLHRVYLTQSRLRRDISCTIEDLGRYRKQRLQRQAEEIKTVRDDFQPGLIWRQGNGERHYAALPSVRGLDGEFHVIPGALLGDPRPVGSSKLPLAPNP